MRVQHDMRFVAAWMAALCIVVFALQAVFGTGVFILDRAIVWQEPWRLVTAVFAHANIGHLLTNLFALLLFGLILEGRIGPNRVLLLFLGAGLVINVFSPYARSLGASGAIYALIGALVMLRPRMTIWLNFVPMPMAVAGVVYILQDMLGLLVPSNVANLAHLAGIAIGLAAGWLWRKQFADEPTLRNGPADPEVDQLLDEWERGHRLR